MEAIKFKLEKLKTEKKNNQNVKNRKTKNMTPEQLGGKTVDHTFDVEGEDGTVTQVPYTGVLTKVIEKE